MRRIALFSWVILLIACGGSTLTAPDPVPDPKDPAPDIQVTSVSVDHSVGITTALTIVQNFGGGGIYKLLFFVDAEGAEILARETPEEVLGQNATFAGNWLVARYVATLTKIQVYQRVLNGEWELSQTYIPLPKD